MAQEVLLREPTKPRLALFASVVAAVTAEAQTVGPGAAEAQRIEPGSPPARQASTPDGIRDAVPRGLGPIPSQLFRPARAQPKTPEAVPGGLESDEQETTEPLRDPQKNGAAARPPR